MKPEIITSAYEGSRIRGLSVARAIHALKMEGVSLGVLLEVYQQRGLDGGARGQYRPPGGTAGPSGQDLLISA
jgi:hypothetical protein